MLNKGFVGLIIMVSLGFLFLDFGFSAKALADWRPYAYSYSYMTAYQGERELELYTDYDYKGSAYNLKNQLEFEYGITEHWMTSVYGVFSSSNKQEYKYTQTKLQTRLRFGEEGQFLLDPAIYAEFKIPAAGGFNTLELKQILSKELGDWNVTGNLVFEKDLKEGADWKQGYTLGVSRPMAETVRGGIEIKGSLGDKPTLYLAPSISLIWNDLKVNLAAGFGATPDSKTMYIRNVVAYEF